jgi:hypothetical protein
MTYLERTVVRHGHPRHMILAIVGFAWAISFLWAHAWIWAAAAAFASVVLGAIVTPRKHEENLAQTTLGKIMLLHLYPANVLLQIAGFAFLLYGVWVHSEIYIMAAGSIILIGHMWGWHRVSEAL